MSDVIYFSPTADTVLQTYSFHLISGKDTSYMYYILRKHSIDTVQLLSSFTLLAKQKLNAYENLSMDTIKKYHLTYEGMPVEPYTNEDFDISVRHSKPRMIDKCEPYSVNKFIYKTKVTIKIKCKQQTVYSKKFNYMFTADSSDEFDTGELTPSVKAWKKENKYFIRYSIRDRQTVKREKSEVSYSIHSYSAFVN
jgi:hypothetical protein